MYSNRAAALTKLLAYRTQDANTFQIPVCFKYPCSQDMIMVEQGVPASESLLHALHEQIVAAFWMPQNLPKRGILMLFETWTSASSWRGMLTARSEDHNWQTLLTFRTPAS